MTNENEGVPIFAILSRIIVIKTLRLIDTSNEKPFDIQKLRFAANEYKEFYLGEDLARNGIIDFKLINKESKEIDNSIFDLIKINDRYLVTERVAFYNITRIKIPTIIQLSETNPQYIKTILMARTDGLGSLVTVNEPLELSFKNDFKSNNGLILPTEFFELFKEFVVEKNDKYFLISNNLKVFFIQEKIIKHIIKDLELSVYVLDYGLYQYKFPLKIGIDELLQFLRGFEIIERNGIINNNLMKIFDVSTLESNSCFIYSENYFQFEEEVNDELLVNRFSLIEHFIIERNFLLSNLSSINFSELEKKDLDYYRGKYLNFSRIDSYYKFSISKNVEFANIVKQVFEIEQIYQEVNKTHDYYLSYVEENENRQMERRNLLLSGISLFIAVPTLFSIVDVFYGLEIKKIFIFPINISKIIYLILTWVIITMVLFKKKK